MQLFAVVFSTKMTHLVLSFVLEKEQTKIAKDDNKISYDVLHKVKLRA